MGKKSKFRPKITKIKLNPEQAVLSCICHTSGWILANGVHGSTPSSQHVCSEPDPRIYFAPGWTYNGESGSGPIGSWAFRGNYSTSS